MIARTRVAATSSPWVREQLAGPTRQVEVIHVGRHAMYVAVPGPRGTASRCVGLLSRSGTMVPCGLRTTLPDLSCVSDPSGPMTAGDVARLGDGVLQLDAADVSIGRILDLSVPHIASADAEAAALRLSASIGSRADAVRAELPARALSMLAQADPAAVPLLLGLGSGLTPVGDDVLAGWLATMNAARCGSNTISDSIAQRAPAATTLLSATLLDRARAGEALPEFARLLRDLPRGSADPPTARLTSDVDSLIAIGHTSGVGLLLGCLLALDHLTTRHDNTANTRSPSS